MSEQFEDPHDASAVILYRQDGTEWWPREGSNLQPDGYVVLALSDVPVISLKKCCLVTQIDTQGLPDGARARANSLIGLVAEEGLEPPTRGL